MRSSKKIIFKYYESSEKIQQNNNVLEILKKETCMLYKSMGEGNLAFSDF